MQLFRIDNFFFFCFWLLLVCFSFSLFYVFLFCQKSYLLYVAVLSYLLAWPCSLNANGRIVCSWPLWKLYICSSILFPLQMICSCSLLYAMRRLKIISFTAGESFTVSDNATTLVPLKTLRHTLPLAGAYLLYMVSIS